MVKGDILREEIRCRGLKLYYVADQLGITQPTLRNKINGKQDFTGPEIYELSQLLGLTPKRRDQIFFA